MTGDHAGAEVGPNAVYPDGVAGELEPGKVLKVLIDRKQFTSGDGDAPPELLVSCN